MLGLTGLSSFPREEPSSLWQPRPLAGKELSGATQKESVQALPWHMGREAPIYSVQVQGLALPPERPVALDGNWWGPAPAVADSTARQFLTCARV